MNDIERLENIIKERSKSEWRKNPYLCGIINGMIFAKSVIDEKEPIYVTPLYPASIEDNNGNMPADYEFKCDSCGDACELVEETFDYAGTHCTGGASGTHKTGVWLSKCCLADYSDC